METFGRNGFGFYLCRFGLNCLSGYRLVLLSRPLSPSSSFISPASPFSLPSIRRCSSGRGAPVCRVFLKIFQRAEASCRGEAVQRTQKTYKMAKQRASRDAACMQRTYLVGRCECEYRICDRFLRGCSRASYRIAAESAFEAESFEMGKNYLYPTHLIIKREKEKWRY